MSVYFRSYLFACFVVLQSSSLLNNASVKKGGGGGGNTTSSKSGTAGQNASKMFLLSTRNDE